MCCAFRGRAALQVVQDDDEDGDGDGDGGYGGAPGGDSGVTQPLLQRVSASLRQRWNPGGPKVSCWAADQHSMHSQSLGGRAAPQHASARLSTPCPLPWLLLQLPCAQMVLRVVPPEPRPDFGAMLGGVRLCGVHLTLRSKTDRLVLADASLELLRGQAAIVTGEGPVHACMHWACGGLGAACLGLPAAQET